MTKSKLKILLFTENFEKRILAEQIIGINNLESFLNNNKNKNRIILEGVTSCYRDKKGDYIPKDHIRGYQIMNTNHIDFAYGPKNLIYSPTNLTSFGETSLLWGMKGLHHALIGDVKVPGNHIPKIPKGLSRKQLHEKEHELANYLDKQLQKNFIPFYNPRADSSDAKKEFGNLFKGINISNETLPVILVNNKKQSNSNTSQSVYLGQGSKNFK